MDTNISSEELVVILQEHISELQHENTSHKSIIKYFEDQNFELRSENAKLNTLVNSQKISIINNSMSQFPDNIFLSNDSRKRTNPNFGADSTQAKRRSHNVSQPSLIEETQVFNELQEQIDELTAKLEAEKQRADKNVDMANEFCKLIDELKLENGSLKTQVTELNNGDKTGDQFNELQQKVSDITQQVDELTVKLEAEKQRSTENADEAKGFCKLIDELKLENGSLKTQVTELNNVDSAATDASQLDELLQCQREKAIAEDKLQQSIENVERLTKQNLMLQRQIDSVKSSVESNQELEALAGELKKSQQDVERLTEQNLTLQQRVELGSEALAEELEKSQQENQQLNKKISDSAKEVNKKVEFLEGEASYMHQEKQYGEAVEFYLRAISLEEFGRNNAKWLGALWNNVAACWTELLKSENTEKVSKAIEEAIGKAGTYDSANAVILFNRGAMHFNKGHRNQAITDIKKVIDLDANYENAKEILKNLEDLQ